MANERLSDIVEIGAALDACFTDFTLLVDDPDWKPEDSDAWEASRDNIKLIHEKLKKVGILDEDRELTNTIEGPQSQDAYKASPNTCPSCGSELLTTGTRSYGDIHMYQDVSCNDCGARWADVYELKGYSELETE